MLVQQSHEGQFTIHGYFVAIRRVEAIGCLLDLLAFKFRCAKLDQV
jgi:hypothetical protein